ncbi:MAG: endonuclease/exonuclease/phosphatase family protein [Acidimicrobiales bacterium]
MADPTELTELTVVTWNVQGRAGLDVGAAADVLTGMGADLVGLQEVQRHQAVALTRRLGPRWRVVWAFKHWPVIAWPETVAILSRYPLSGRRVLVLRPALPVRSRRRVAVVADVAVADAPVRFASTHLSPAATDGEWRRRELARVGATRADVVVGDLNVRDLDELGSVVGRAGWSDCWDPGQGTGCTHWGPGSRFGREPDHRLDYVLANRRFRPVECEVPTPDGRLASLSDHLPVRTVLRSAQRSSSVVTDE